MYSSAMDMKELRENSGKRVELIAGILEISASTVWNWEQGKHEPRLPLTAIPKFLEVYNCSLDEAIEATIESQRLFAQNQDE